MNDKTQGPFELLLPDEATTLTLGRHLAAALSPQAPAMKIFLQGGLGAGKTTLVRALAQALPGGDQARVGSPSFNVMNLYPTVPPMAHFDFYRLELQGPDDEMLDLLHDERHFVAVEWSEHLPERLLPAGYVRLRLRPDGAGRTAQLHAVGGDAAAYVQRVVDLMSET